MGEKILLFDSGTPELRAFSRFRCLFSIRDGIFTPIERLQRLKPGCEIFFLHADEEYESLVSEISSVRGLGPSPARGRDAILRDAISGAVEGFDALIASDALRPTTLLENVGSRIIEDISLLGETIKDFGHGVDKKNVVGELDQILIHETAKVFPGTIFNTEVGPIVIDQGAVISPFTYVEGPAYVGKNARIDNARIVGGCVFGQECRIGGEVENSLFDDFSNKHHEGFVGHSILGQWVNVGAIATTSDLKNNYGEVRLRLESGTADGSELETGTIKFGSLIGDCVKIAIGTMLNTGTVLDAGSNVFGGAPGKYVPPLSWGLTGERYDLGRFLSDCEKIFARRNEKPHPNLKRLAEKIIQIRR